MTKPRVLLILTQDTKEQEGRFARSVLEANGCDVVHLDPSILRTVGGAQISPEQIAGAAGTTIEAVRALRHEGKCQEVMIGGALKLALTGHGRACRRWRPPASVRRTSRPLRLAWRSRIRGSIAGESAVFLRKAS